MNDFLINDEAFSCAQEHLGSRIQFSLDAVSPDIQKQSRNTFSMLLHKMGQVSLESIGDKLHCHKSNVCRMKENGELEKASAIFVALDIDVPAMQKEIEELRKQNQALQVVAMSNLKISRG